MKVPLCILPTFFSSTFSCGQISAPAVPQPHQFTPITIVTGSTVHAPFESDKQHTYHTNELVTTDFLPPKQSESVRQVQELVHEVAIARSAIATQLPVITRQKQQFSEAFNEISQMLNNDRKIDLKRAVFLSENAFADGTMNYDVFCGQISRVATLLKIQMEAENLPVNDPLAINYIVYRFMCDTLRIQDGEKVITTFPKTYDFNDPFGLKEVRQLFVSKLIKTGKGQCKSLPLLYLILVQELNGEAWLAFSPSHSFIKCKDRNGFLYNLELTNGHIASDAWIVGSGQVKAEAIRSGIYLDTLNTRQVIANCLVDLAYYYSWRFGKNNVQMGYDEFSLQCFDLALKYHPTNINAILGKSDYYTVLLNYAAWKKGYTTEQQLLSDPATAAIFHDRNKLYALTDSLGYEYFGEASYLKWLQTPDPQPSTLTTD